MRMVKAEMNHGRWIAECPFCPGAELVKPDQVFRCQSCRMKATGGQPLLVEFPDDATAIEATLALRLLHNRNWKSGETLNDLHAENVEHSQ